jgi:hypothetical protein
MDATDISRDRESMKRSLLFSISKFPVGADPSKYQTNNSQTSSGSGSGGLLMVVVVMVPVMRWRSSACGGGSSRDGGSGGRSGCFLIIDQYWTNKRDLKFLWDRGRNLCGHNGRILVVIRLRGLGLLVYSDILDIARTEHDKIKNIR